MRRIRRNSPPSGEIRVRVAKLGETWKISRIWKSYVCPKSTSISILTMALKVLPVSRGKEMKKLLLLGVVVLGISGLSLGQNNNNQGQNEDKNGKEADDNEGKQNGKKVKVPEGVVVELPLFLSGLGLWLWWRHRSHRNLETNTQV